MHTGQSRLESSCVFCLNFIYLFLPRPSKQCKYSQLLLYKDLKHVGKMLCQVERYFVRRKDALSGGKMLCQVERCFVRWKDALSSGKMLCQVERCFVRWKDALSGGKMLCQVERCFVRWKDALSGGKMLCQVERCFVRWKDALSGGKMLCQVERCFVRWKDALSGGKMLCQVERCFVRWKNGQNYSKYRGTNWTAVLDENRWKAFERYERSFRPQISSCKVNEIFVCNGNVDKNYVLLFLLVLEDQIWCQITFSWI